MRNILNQKKYEAKEVNQSATIINAYVKTIGELPIALAVEEKDGGVYPKTTPMDAELNASFWHSRMSAVGPLSTCAQDLTSMLCAWQAERLERVAWNSGYEDDPLQRVCEEFKEWLVKLSAAGCTEELLEEVQKRITYIGILIASPHFKPDACDEGPSRVGISAGTTTFFHSLIQLRQVLKQHVCTTIAAELANTSALKDMEKMLSAYNAMIYSGVNFLFYSFSNNEKERPTNFNLSQFLVGKSAAYADTLKTLTAQCTLALAKLAAPLNISYSPIKKEVKPLAAQPFLDREGHLCLPMEGDLAKLDHFAGKESDICDIFKKPFTNYADQPQNLPELFIKMHALLAELIAQYDQWKLTQKLAGAGGDLALYGFAHDAFMSLLNVSESMLKILRDTMQQFYDVCYSYLSMLTEENTSKDKAWLNNFLYGEQHFERAIKTMTDALEHLNAIRGRANTLTVVERLRQLRQEIDVYVTHIGDYTGAVNARWQLGFALGNTASADADAALDAAAQVEATEAAQQSMKVIGPVAQQAGIAVAPASISVRPALHKTAAVLPGGSRGGAPTSVSWSLGAPAVDSSALASQGKETDLLLPK